MNMKEFWDVTASISFFALQNSSLGPVFRRERESAFLLIFASFDTHRGILQS